MTPAPIPTLLDVERTSALSDPVLRNLQITQCYHELAHVLAERTGPKANWCTFATWASRQAGQTIRKEDLRRLLESSLEGRLEGNVPNLHATQELQAAAQQIGPQRAGIGLRLDEFAQLAWKAY